MFTEEESFALSSLNAAQGICSYDDNNEQRRLLTINETGVLALRAGLGPTGNRYGLERLTVESLPDGAKLVGCNVVRSSRGGTGSLGMVVALATAAPPLSAPCGTKQGDAAGGPNVRSAGAAQNPEAAAAAAGVLNVYALGGERSFEVERALQRQPQQQLLLSFAPEGMALTKVWRNVAAPPNFVGGEGEGGEEEGGGTSSPTSPTNSNRRFKVERGDAVLVWDQDGVVHGYTRWEGGGGCLPAADSSTSRVAGGGGGSGGAAAGSTSTLAAESRESLETLIPELKDIDGPVSCVSFDVVEDWDGAMRRRRWMLTGCKDSARCSSLDVTSGRRETAISSVAGPVCAVALNTRPRFMPHHQRGDGFWGGDVAGFACTELDMLAWLLKGGGDGNGGRRRPRWRSRPLPLTGAGGDQLTCMECADFCRDGSTSVVVGTNTGKVIIYGVDADPSGSVATTTAGGADSTGDDEGLAFGLENVDFEDGNEDEDSGSTDVAARRGDCTSPRLPGAPAAAASTAPAEKQHHGRRGMERAGSCDGVAEHPSKNSSSSQPLLSVRWQRDVPHGVMSIACGDFNHDGVSELVVVTKYGVHVFHPDLREETSRFAKTMYALRMLQPKEEEEEQEEEEEEGEKQEDDSMGSTSDDEQKSSRDVNSFGVESRNAARSADLAANEFVLR